MIGEVKHTDIGQMNMYLNYFKEEENVENDNPPIGIILAASKDEIMVRYATGGLSNKLFVSKYQTYLPEKDLLQKRVRACVKISDTVNLLFIDYLYPLSVAFIFTQALRKILDEEN